MKIKLNNRQFLSVAIIFFYLLPLLFFSFYSIGLMSRHKSWSVLSLGLLITACGALALILLLYYWEQILREKIQEEKRFLTVDDAGAFFISQEGKETKVTSLDSHLLIDHILPLETINPIPMDESNDQEPTLQDAKETPSDLTKNGQSKELEIKSLQEDNHQLNQKANRIAQDFSDYKIFSEEQLKQKNLQIVGFQKTIEDQRTETDKQQEQIQFLETKVHDLSYEIKTLLYLNETDAPVKRPDSPSVVEPSFKISAIYSDEDNPLPSFSPYGVAPAKSIHSDHSLSLLEETIQTAAEAAAILKRCVNSAEKLTGAHYYGQEASRYRDFSSPYHTIDQRRLFDSLRAETGVMILVYSQKEQRLTFVNHQCKSWLGWSPEKFTQDFLSIIQEGLIEWKKALSLLGNDSDAQLRLLMKTKSGQELLLNCHLETIPSGLFRNHVIGALYPA